jgi:hypothetical protein
MDLKVREELERAGLKELDRPELLQVAIELENPDGHPLPLGEEVPVVDEVKTRARVRLGSISRLWASTELKPSPTSPSSRHLAFLLLMESTAGIYCSSVTRPVTDADFERLYLKLRQHPDGEDPHPLFSYLQGAARLYLSLRDMSQPEYESLLRRLSTLVGRFRANMGSTNYHHRVVNSVLGS